MNVTISLVPFQTLLYVLPTLLFFVSTLSRIFMTFSTRRNPMQDFFKLTEGSLTEALKEYTGKQDVDTNTVLKRIVEQAMNKVPYKDSNIFKENIFVSNERQKRNSEFLYGLFIDSLALSVANGVIIMFSALNLLNGFILMFLGIVISSFGFTLLYSEHIQGAAFLGFVAIFGLFLTEFFYLLTTDSYWLIKIPEYVALVSLVFVVIIVTWQRQKTKKEKSKEKSINKNEPR